MSGASRETWERAAEELVRYVRLLLSDHGSAIEKALKKSIGKDQAEAEIQQLEHLVVALELELWRRRTGPREALVIPAVRCIRTTLLAIGLSVTSVVTAEVYKDLTAAQEQAEKVCLLQENDGSFSLDQPGAPTRGKAPARPFLEDDEQGAVDPPDWVSEREEREQRETAYREMVGLGASDPVPEPVEVGGAYRDPSSRSIDWARSARRRAGPAHRHKRHV